MPWLPCKQNGFLMTEVPDQLRDITLQSLMQVNQRVRDEEILQDICNDRDRLLITQIPLLMRDRDDEWFWMFEDKGEFTVRSGYRVLQGEESTTDAALWKRIWKFKVPGKVVNFVWRVMRNCLPTASALITKNVQINVFCPWCHMAEETSMHVLLNCHFAQDVWEAVGLWQTVKERSGETLFQLFGRVVMGSTTEQCTLICLICWNLWNRRNRWVWEHVNNSVFGVRESVVRMLNEWKKANEVEGRTDRQR